MKKRKPLSIITFLYNTLLGKSPSLLLALHPILPPTRFELTTPGCQTSVLTITPQLFLLV